ncbi:MAG: hypothetical protein ACRCYO_01270, partial [Bacteroidia bacterium]
TTELPRYLPDTTWQTVVLENGYAKSKIINPDDWIGSEGICVREIKLIYTKYPVDESFWLTNYHRLLADRLIELFRIDSSLNSAAIKWTIVLQTDCKTAKLAQKRFHGIEICYEECGTPSIALPNDSLVSKEKKRMDSLRYVRSSKKVERYIATHGGISDSTVWKVLKRHPEWKNALVVMDFTGSMYPYAGQVLLWHAKNLGKTGMEYCVFFNDGDHKRDDRKITGATGGIYFSKTQNIDAVIRLMQKVQSKGNGGDAQENNIEAILAGINHFSGFDHVILIADNNACMRDYTLMHKVNIPIHVILCGTYTGINPQYVELAQKTSGSLHTIEDDLQGTTSFENNTDLENEMTRFREQHFGVHLPLVHIRGRRDPCGSVPKAHKPKKKPLKKRISNFLKRIF